ncbi:DUF2844 domain-containing protein [Burkholderia ubonensis]|uniref:DUF2844 domain-containing protein n=1 Tax=Burkholderia ubonensis TaxID=101571 RepID=UPI00387E0982
MEHPRARGTGRRADVAAGGRPYRHRARAAARDARGRRLVAAYTVRELSLASGTVIHEYTSAAGTVFGVAWRGPSMPDLGQVFGSYLPQYKAGVEAAHAARGWRAPVSVDSSAIVIRTGGHMGSFSGQAWLPQALPAGVTGNDIQ